MQFFIEVLFIFIFINGAHSSSDAERPVTKTKYGYVRGIAKQVEEFPNIQYYAFLGVPFARAPVGSLRFQNAVPPEKWNGVRDADKSADVCAQTNGMFTETEVIGSEDCLYLDIYVPINIKFTAEPLPVMAWIHGGTFIFGSATEDTPEHLMTGNVIVVQIAYRLNVFGFLSTNDKFAEGNQGLKDQAFALNWIQENIHYFGGNPEKVTIFGASAGGASVFYQMLSCKSVGLFHRGISQSGNSLNRWALQRNPLTMTKKLAKGLNITTENTESLVQQLQKVDYRVLMKAAFNQSIMGHIILYHAQPFCPTIESESDTAFLSESTFKLLEEKRICNKVPFITGYTTEEGTFAYSYVNNSVVNISIYETHPQLLIPISMNIKDKNSMCFASVLNAIRQFYFKNGSVTDVPNWINLMSQDLIVRGIQRAVDFVYAEMPTYMYKFSYRPSFSTSFLGGVGHYEDVAFLFITKRNTTLSPEDKIISKRYVKLWTNFAKTGNPTPTSEDLLQNIIWPKIDQNKVILNIDKDLKLEKQKQDHFVFWEKQFKDCGIPPFYTF